MKFGVLFGQVRVVPHSVDHTVRSHRLTVTSCELGTDAPHSSWATNESDLVQHTSFVPIRQPVNVEAICT